MVSDLRTATSESLFGHLKGQRALLIGVGGGGDVVGTLPTYFDLERLGALPQTGGLTWKRRPHDPKALPRHVHEFRNLVRINDWIGLVDQETSVEGIKHIEADVAAALGGRKVLTIDVSGGAARVRAALREYTEDNEIAQVIAIDVGGDALCRGHEATIKSPLCDQIMLAALAEFPGAILGVIGLGADGELSMADFYERFDVLLKLGAYQGALEIHPGDLGRLQQVLVAAKTECSKHPVRIAAQTPPWKVHEVHALMNCAKPDPRKAMNSIATVDLRAGTRTGELTELTGFTLYFDLPKVYTSNRFSHFLDETLGVWELNKVLVQKGYITEIIEDVVCQRRLKT